MSNYKAIKANWDKELSKARPSFFRACFKAHTGIFVGLILLLSLGMLCLLASPILIKLLVDFFGKDDKDMTEGLILALLFGLFGTLYSIISQFTSSFGQITSARIKSGISYMIFKKLAKLDYLTVGRSAGRVLATLGGDVEAWNTAQFVLTIPALFVYVVGSAVLIWLFAGIAGMIGLAFIVFEMVLIRVITVATTKLKLRLGEFTNKRV